MANATLIDGKALAAEITGNVRKEAEALAASGRRPGLAVVIVGEDPASQVYVRNKQRTAENCGFHSVRHALDESVTEQALLNLVTSLNEDPDRVRDEIKDFVAEELLPLLAKK